ncbi:hypothetical protein EDD22DRAFT_912961 [Suillus occidentalis]|nr:hypothetical protein EDD22DRAFT_912961 [Suillus occidentalis]
MAQYLHAWLLSGTLLPLQSDQCMYLNCHVHASFQSTSLTCHSIPKRHADSDYRCTCSILQCSQYAQEPLQDTGKQRKGSPIEGRPHGDGPSAKTTQTPTMNAYI